MNYKLNIFIYKEHGQLYYEEKDNKANMLKNHYKYILVSKYV